MSWINLNHDWRVRFEDLSRGPEYSAIVTDTQEGWMDACLPCDVHMPLIENGIIKEPLEADHFLECGWVEQKSWWFKKVFSADAQFITGDACELTLESLDAEADVFLNGVYLGHQRSAFYPFRKEVKAYLKAEDNILLVRVTSGLEHVSDNELALIRECVSTEMEKERDRTYTRGDKRRAFVRKPQYVYGWDWGPRVATCGIMKNAYLESLQRVVVRSVHAFTAKASETAEIEFKVEIENLHPYTTLDAVVRIELFLGSGKVKEMTREEFLRSGMNYVSVGAKLENAELWWPNGMGAQALYTVKVSLEAGENIARYPDFRFGIRTIRLAMDRINEKERLFAFEINGVKVFCKGGNWIPADSIYARVSDEKYDTLLREAREANFNMLRIWGGGLYERDIFYEKCDEYGILLWHDFMFACAKYPDHLDWFREEVRSEMDYQTGRLRNHPSIVLWSGNNENHWGFDSWWNHKANAWFYGGAECYNRIAPGIVHRNCPEIPYWNSSPYGGKEPNSSEIGDRHHWGDCMMNAVMEKRITPEEYDGVTAKFVSEYGYVGPCRKSSTLRYHGAAPVNRGSEIWNHHNNTFEKDTVEAGIHRHYADAGKLDLDEYLLYAGLCQGLMYGYSLEALRFKKYCWGSLFWMYSDCWGEVGWTIVDYYLKRKISYYFVKRAFAPKKWILRENHGRVEVMGINETDMKIELPAAYGYVRFDSTEEAARETVVTMEPYSRKPVLQFEKEEKDAAKGCYFVKPLDGKHGILPAILRTGVFKELQIPAAEIEITDFAREGNTAGFTVSSSVFAHAVHFNLDEGIPLSDEYFDLLPGESRRITAHNIPDRFAKELIQVACIVK